MVIDQGRKFWTANGNFEQFKRTFFENCDVAPLWSILRLHFILQQISIGRK